MNQVIALQHRDKRPRTHHSKIPVHLPYQRLCPHRLTGVHIDLRLQINQITAFPHQPFHLIDHTLFRTLRQFVSMHQTELIILHDNLSLRNLIGHIDMIAPAKTKCNRNIQFLQLFLQAADHELKVVLGHIRTKHQHLILIIAENAISLKYRLQYFCNADQLSAARQIAQITVHIRKTDNIRCDNSHRTHNIILQTVYPQNKAVAVPQSGQVVMGCLIFPHLHDPLCHGSCHHIFRQHM